MTRHVPHRMADQKRAASTAAATLLAFAGFCFRGADFAHRGVAGALAGAPHVPARDGTVRAPAFAKREALFRFRQVFFAVCNGPAFLDSEVANRENVGSAQPKDQEHFYRPPANAANGSEA